MNIKWSFIKLVAIISAAVLLIVASVLLTVGMSGAIASGGIFLVAATLLTVLLTTALTIGFWSDFGLKRSTCMHRYTAVRRGSPDELLAALEPCGKKFVESRNTKGLCLSEKVHVFHFADTLQALVGSHYLETDNVDPSERHYYGGEVHTISDIERIFPKEAEQLTKELKSCSASKAIRLTNGLWRPFFDTDEYVATAGTFTDYAGITLRLQVRPC